jgi:tricorn protease
VALGAPEPKAQTPATSGTAPTGPIRLIRHPDYHAGKIAFSYLGDIWTANEDGSGPERLTINTARETFPRFSPDGRSIAFTSNRFGIQRSADGLPRKCLRDQEPGRGDAAAARRSPPTR